MQKVPTKAEMNYQLPHCGWARKGQKLAPFLIAEINADDGSAFGYLGGDNKTIKAGQWFLSRPSDDGDPTWSELLGQR